MIGAIGSRFIEDVILFEVSPERVLTLDNFVRRNGVRFAENNTLLRKPVSQYIGPALDAISFSIKLKAEYGVNPKEEFNKLIHLQRSGASLSIMLGRRAFGVFRWRINSLGIPEERIDNMGICLSSTVSIDLREYV